MLTKSNAIYSFAKRAKERLKKNNYSAIPSSRSINNADIITSYISSHKNKSIKRTITMPSKTGGEEFYQKVCSIIESGRLSNPISELIDREYFNSLCVEEKQHYISSLTQKFKASKDRYFKEHMSSINY